jgi:hypothetical protein
MPNNQIRQDSYEGYSDEDLQEEEDCNLTDTEEEKTHLQNSTQKKAFLSIDKILNSIKKDANMTANTTLNNTVNMDDITLDQFGTMQRYKRTVPGLIAKKLDQVLLRQTVLKCRGFLQRRSLKYSKKWQKGFFYLDISKFTQTKTEKILLAFSVRESVYKQDILSLRHLKRIRLGCDTQLLAVPRYSTAKKSGATPVLQDYLCFMYQSEERVLSDIVYQFKDSRDFPASIAKDLVAQIYFKAILNCAVMSPKDIEKI